MLTPNHSLANVRMKILATTANAYKAKFPHVSGKDARNYAIDTFRMDCDRAILACDPKWSHWTTDPDVF